MLNRFIILIFILASVCLAQDNPEDDVVTIKGDRYEGKKIGGRDVREIIGNVVITQAGATITCDRAIQFLDDDNAELTGNVILVQDTTIVRTPKAYYYGSTKTTYSVSGVQLIDGKVTLESDSGYYHLDTRIARFRGNVKLYDLINNLESDSLIYYRDLRKAEAAGRVKLRDTGSVMFADSLVHFQDAGDTYAFKNIVIKNFTNNTLITGNYLEDFRKQARRFITGEPLLVKIDTLEDGRYDTLFIEAKEMYATGDSADVIIAKDSVRIIRGDFSSFNSETTMIQGEDRIFLYRKPEDSYPPVIWIEDSQLSGDSINIFLDGNDLKKVFVNRNALVISRNKGYNFRFDQISGDSLKMNFTERKLNRTEVYGNVLSIYYMYENEEANGLIKSSAGSTSIYFRENKISDVKMFTAPISEYHPENLVEGNEQSFTIPGFVIYKFRPDKESVLKRIENIKISE